MSKKKKERKEEGKEERAEKKVVKPDIDKGQLFILGMDKNYDDREAFFLDVAGECVLTQITIIYTFLSNVLSRYDMENEILKEGGEKEYLLPYYARLLICCSALHDLLEYFEIATPEGELVADIEGSEGN